MKIRPEELDALIKKLKDAEKDEDDAVKMYQDIVRMGQNAGQSLVVSSVRPIVNDEMRHSSIFEGLIKTVEGEQKKLREEAEKKREEERKKSQGHYVQEFEAENRTKRYGRR